MTTIAKDLPFHQDIMAEIFKRLPIASLVRFSSVSKSLYCLIHSRSFIAVHLAHQKSSSLTRYISGGYLNSGPHMRDFYIHDQNLSSYTRLRNPESLPTQCYQFVGSCDGLVCLKHGRNLGENGGDICLWNPWIHKVKILPRCQNQFRKVRDYNVCLAFGFDCRNSLDYKVVRFVYFKRYNYRRKFCVEVYSLNSDSWKRVIDGVNCESALSVDGVSSVSMNGVAYWLAAKDRDIKSSPQTADLIASFDMGSEKLTEISLPDSVSGSPLHRISIANLRESLALLHVCRNIADIEGEYDIWILQGSTSTSIHSWTKKLSIFLHSNSSSFRLVPAKLDLITREQMISFSKDGEAVIFPIDYSIHSYDLESKQGTRLGFCGQLVRPVESFSESLVLLGIRNSIPGFAKSFLDKNSYSFPRFTKQQNQGGRKILMRMPNQGGRKTLKRVRR